MYSAIRHIAKSLHPRSREASIPVAIATAYFDESISSQACAVAGLVTTIDHWVKFDEDWSRLLDKYKIGALHMKDYAHSNGEFQTWKGDEVKRRQFLERVIDILARRNMTAIGIVIDRGAFARTIAQDEFISNFYVNEYSTASVMSLLGTQVWASSRPLEKPVDFVFDRGNPHRKDFQRAYDFVRMVPFEAKALGALSFADDSQVAALQAADFVAYETCKIYSDLEKGQRRFRASMKAIMTRVNHDIKVPTEEKLAGLVKKMRELPD